MDKPRALEVVNTLASGVDPFTGEIFPAQSTLQNPEVVRALYVAAIALGNEISGRKPAKASNANQPEKAGLPWSADEDRELLTAFDSGRSEKELAATHQRTLNAIRARLVRFGRLQLPNPRADG